MGRLGVTNVYISWVVSEYLVNGVLGTRREHAGPPGWNDTRNDTPGGAFVVRVARLRANAHPRVRSALSVGGQSIDFPVCVCGEASFRMPKPLFSVGAKRENIK